MKAFQARALWITAPEASEIREVNGQAAADNVLVKTLFSGISRGTERLVFGGHVPPTEHEMMRAPFQDGDFSFPVKYGYAAVGEVQSGVLEGHAVFALHPHQSHFAVPQSAIFAVPENVPPSRAVLAANMETAINIVWDAGIGPGDKVAVVGCGVVGALAGYLAGRIPGTEVTLIDIDPDRASLADPLGCAFAHPDIEMDDADVVIHASATDAGLATAIGLAGVEATIIEASWYGTRVTQAPLGGRFHQRRLQIIGSQVGRIPAERAARWTFARRLQKALSLLADERLDTLISGETQFSDLARDYGAILADRSTLCHRVRYDG